MRSAPLVLALFIVAAVPAAAETPRVHAIVGARIVVAPGQVLERATVVMRDGVITAVGTNVAVPADARVWPGDSLIVYPGLIDAYVEAPEVSLEGGAARAPAVRRGPQASAPPQTKHAIPSVRPERRAVTELPLPRLLADTLRSIGFAVAQVTPRGGIFRGSSTVVGLGSEGERSNVLVDDACQVVALEPAEENEYPGSLMGAIAVVRQTLSDARWYHDAWQLYRKAPGRESPGANVALEALEPVVMGKRPALFVADHMLEVLRSAEIAREAQVGAVIVGRGDEYKRAKEIAATRASLIVPVAYPDPPDVSDPDVAIDVRLTDLRDWEHAPGNGAALSRAGIPFALTAKGLRDPRTFRRNVARAIRRGLDPKTALAAVTTEPARMLGLSDRLGTIAAGKIANLTVTRGDLFSDNGSVREVWVSGNRHVVPVADTSVAGTWSLAAGRVLRVVAAAETSVRIIRGTDTTRVTGAAIHPGALVFRDGPARYNLALREDRLVGSVQDGSTARNVALWRVVEDRTRSRRPDDPVPVSQVAGDPEAWRAPRPEQAKVLLVKNATVWTAGPRGTLEKADLLVRGGVIAAVGPNLTAPNGATVIDGTGKHVAPGIIDAHSHTAILGGVNECTHNITAEVRIADVVNSENIGLYRELAGGTTAMHLLHGSCNSIGGQCVLVKGRWGEPSDALRFADTPPTIKFALGENPKRSNSDARSERYPQSRGGVEQSIREAFAAARDYGLERAQWRKGAPGYPPRRDLQKEAVLEIVEGKRMIHSHSYRQDEILMLMRVADEFGIKVACFQHVLEGYKVADEMAAHGATASTFSDWWAYKYEVIDGIPHNGYLMWDRGVTVSYNSDSDELARRLNTEAAKAVKYGGVPPEEAIRFVTLNPAKQLRVDHRIGSLEPGKDADFSIWNGSPLSPFSLCEQTWIEGRRYFDRAADLAGRAALEAEKLALIDKARRARRDTPGAARMARPAYLEQSDVSDNSCGGELDREHEARREGGR